MLFVIYSELYVVLKNHQWKQYLVQKKQNNPGSFPLTEFYFREQTRFFNISFVLFLEFLRRTLDSASGATVF